MFRPKHATAALSIAFILITAAPIWAGQTPANERRLAVISDLHMGIGRDGGKEWNPTEDFRWTGALKGFLEYVSRESGDRADLVVAGDLLELWQPPARVKCIGDGADAGCTIPELKQIVSAVISAHSEDFAGLVAFSRRGENRIHILPGNHDAALLIPEIWELMSKALGGESGRISFVKTGLWASNDGRILIEHGHQISSDVNRYKEWPAVTVSRNGRDFLIRPWGELFLQRLFNAEEREYPIIDNLSPEAAGARYRMADRGLWKSAKDLARFIAFNLFETSTAQKAASLSRASGEEHIPEPCSRNLAHRLFIENLPLEDPFRLQAEDNSPEAQELRSMLDALAQNLPEEDIEQLCARRTAASELGAAIESAVVPRTKVLSKHIEDRLAAYPNMKLFVYGHTHQLEEPWPLKIENKSAITVLNSGAFQRLVDEPGFLQRSKNFDSPQEGLRRIGLDALAPCYSVVFVRYKNGIPQAETSLWHMPDGGTGQLRSPGASACK